MLTTIHYTSTRDVIAFIIKEIKRTQSPAREIVTEDLVKTFNPEVLHGFARVGAMREAANFMSNERGGIAAAENMLNINNNNKSKRTGFRADGANPQQSILSTLSMEGDDGRIKPLMEFTLADLEVLYTSCKQQETGWGKKRKWVEAARDLTKKHRVSRISALPKVQTSKLAVLAVEAWL